MTLWLNWRRRCHRGAPRLQCAGALCCAMRDAHRGAQSAPLAGTAFSRRNAAAALVEHWCESLDGA
jgi:hypothetical protein